MRLCYLTHHMKHTRDALGWLGEYLCMLHLNHLTGHWNPERFINSFTARTKAVILNSPHNPTGKVFTKDELETIAGACCRRDCIAITDEVWF
uniref:Aminotransferase class I/classII large domain-containing protein n=2 Tax=Salix viminalis TaxID=40686 RepID=A0A6N2M9S9_SALVM